MKAIRIFIFIFSLCLFFPHLNAQPELLLLEPEQTISMDFQDANLKDILKIFSIQSGLNFIASEAVQNRKITLYLDKVPLQETMDKLFKANNLSYDLDKDSNIFIVKDWGKPQIETITKVFYLKHATVSSSSLKEEMTYKISPSATATGAGGAGAAAGGGYGGAAGGAGGAGGGQTGKWKVEEDAGITESVKKILSEYGSVIEDFRTNSLIVTDIPSRMPVIAATIAALDIPAPQVMLEVEMLDVSKNTLERIGIKFGDITNYPDILTANFTGAARQTAYPLKAFNPSDVRTAGTFTPGSVSFATSYRILLSFIRAQTDTKYLARPRLLTLNNETAEIKITTQEVIGETLAYDDQGNVSSRTAERTETGVSLRVTPQINLERNEIKMFITPKVTEASTSSFSSSYRDPEIRETKSLVNVKDGETVIIGGLIRNESSQTITKLPILGDIPLLGALFRHKNKEKGKERELLVFITPHLVKDTNIELAQAKPISLAEREQDTASGIDRETTISASLNNFEHRKSAK